MKKIAQLISLFFNPFILSLALILLAIERSHLSERLRLFFALYAVLVHGLLPALLIHLWIKKGRPIDDVLGNKDLLKNRSFVLAWAVGVFFLELLFLSLLEKPQPLFSVTLAQLLLVWALFLVNQRYKISLHMSLATLFVLLLLSLIGLGFWPCLVVLPLVFWSRLYLHRHTPKQLWAGFLVGLLVGGGFWYFTLY